jgi:hypothetical protein
MVALDIRIELPETLAREAQASGLLTSQAIESLIREEMRRRRGREFLEIAEQISALDLPPLTDAELEAEIQAARIEKRSRHAGGG